RVIVKEKYRMSGLGKELMFQSINYCKLKFSENHQIIISAQEYLSKFYTDIGFKQISETYLEDNIPHIKMKFYY
ncbi:MAG: GNAT family N-acetyltransferase, partial [Bacteroidota bacterium]